MRARGRPLALMQQFAHDTRAVAAVEFALILPLLLTLYLGAIEGSSLITVDRRVNIISSTIADLVSRWDPEAGPIPLDELEDYFEASEELIYPYSAGGLRMIVSVVNVPTSGAPSVEWSCASGGATKHTADAEYELPDEIQELAASQTEESRRFVVAAEVVYPYKPLLGLVMSETYPLNSRTYYLPRFQEMIDGPEDC